MTTVLSSDEVNNVDDDVMILTSVDTPLVLETPTIIPAGSDDSLVSARDEPENEVTGPEDNLLVLTSLTPDTQ